MQREEEKRAGGGSEGERFEGTVVWMLCDVPSVFQESQHADRRQEE